MKDESSQASLIQRESFFWSPDYLEPSAWIEHIPFAFWLIEVLQPKSLVELGVHNGTSYFSFCQAVKRLNLETTCYAVDSWKGDEHSGFYEEEVFSKVNGYNLSQYPRFSTLIRASFDDSRNYFVDNSIDLLHIDGFHTYEAVKHDFEQWLPRLSSNAVVMIHDINVRERDFGVFQFWEELKRKYQYFQFDFGHGLGVITLQESFHPDLSKLFNEKNGSYFKFLRNLFSERGTFFKTRLDYSLALTEKNEMIDRLIPEGKNLAKAVESSEQEKIQLKFIISTLEAENELNKANYYRIVDNYDLLSVASNNYLVKLNETEALYKNISKDHAELQEQLRASLSKKKQIEDDYQSLSLIYGKLKDNFKIVEANNFRIQESHQAGVTEYSDKLKTAHTSLDKVYEELENTRQENKLLHKYLDWYKATFEERSIFGIGKDRLKQLFKNFYLGIINWLLARKVIKPKYALSFALTYIKENGVKFSVKKASHLIKTKGLKGISRFELRKKAIEKIKKEYEYGIPVIHTIDYTLLKEQSAKFSYRPKVSVIFPTYNTKPGLLSLALESVRSQIYDNWELCVVDDCSTNKETISLLKAYQHMPDMKVIFLEANTGISKASNRALDVATGDLVALMDHDDELSPDAFYWIVKEMNDHPNTDIIYTDECKINEQGKLSDFFFKPDWSPELLFNMMYTGHLTVYRREFLKKDVGYFRPEYDFSQDYDLMLRSVEKTNNIRHVEKVLYYWRQTDGSASVGGKPFARQTNMAALGAAMQRRNIPADIIELPTANRVRVRVDPSIKISIIIPTDSFKNLSDSINSILENTSYKSYEIIAVANSPLCEQMKAIFRQNNIEFIGYDKPYNFSDKCNLGATAASGEILVFFNDDVRPLQADWLENTIEYFSVPGVGGISPKLIYENDTIQYAGMATGVRNFTGTTFHAHHKDSISYLNFPQLVRNVNILSGALLAIRKKLFFEIGEFDAVNFPIAHSDMDLSFKIQEAGYRCVYTPHATLRHIGHLSLSEHKKKEVSFKKDKADILLLKNWPRYIQKDIYFTESMRNLLYQDSPEPFWIYAPFNKVKETESKGDVILISHDLSLSGAPIMLYDTARVLRKNGYFVVVICPEHGPLIEMYQEAEVVTIIDPLVLREHNSFERLARNFDLIICNTIVTWPVVKQMGNKVKTVWWIQEGEVINHFTGNSEFVNTLKSARNLVGVSDYSISFVHNYNLNVTKIYNASNDILKIYSKPKNPDQKKTVFSLIGSFEYRKGHDILISALERLDASYHDKLEIWIIGRIHDQNLFNLLLERISKLPFVKLMGERKHKECLALMGDIDVVLNISRDDPFPVVLVEAMCLGKTCIMSSHSGVSELIDQGQNGYIFRNEDEVDLSKKITNILNDPSKLKGVGKNARLTYEAHLSMEKFETQVLQYIETV